MKQLLPDLLDPLTAMDPQTLNASEHGLNLVREIPSLAIFLGAQMPNMLKQGKFIRFDPDSAKRTWDHSSEELLLLPQTNTDEKWVIGIQKSIRPNALLNGYRHSYTLYLVSAKKPQRACHPERFIEKVKSESARLSLAHFEQRRGGSLRIKHAHIDNNPFSTTVKRFMDTVMHIDGHGHRFP
ncbi:MAG: hypothetical protein AAB575_03860 [Patescibacteria group bacterium]